MPFKCVVPGCRSNYSHVKGTRSIPMMRFPTNPDMADAWIKAIHRPGFIPTAHSHVCIKHFKSDEQIWREYFRQPDGSYRNVIRRHAKLRPSAVPTIFDVDPSQWKMRSRQERSRRRSPKSDQGCCEIITGYKVQFKPEMWEDQPDEKEEAAEQPPPVKRPRGRPVKRPRGRPRKILLVTPKPKVDSSNIDKIDYVPCCALACTNTSETHIMNSLPRDKYLRQCWVEKIDRIFWTPDEESALCEVHFENEMWESNVGEQKILKLGAIPSLCLHGEAIKSWVTLDSSSNVLVGNQDSNEVIEVSQSESEDEDPDIYVKREALEPQIDMVEGVEDVLCHNPDSTGEQFETIYCDTTYNEDEDSDDEPQALHIKEENDYNESSVQDETAGNPLEPDSFDGYPMNVNNDISLIQDDQVTCLIEKSGKVKPVGKPENPLKSNYFVISRPNYASKKIIKRRRSCQLTDEFQCPMCFKKLSRKKNLDIHIEKLHKNGELSEYQMHMRKNGSKNLNEDDCILRKHLQVKKPPPPLSPIGSNCVLSSPLPVKSSALPLPALKPIIAPKGMLSPSSNVPQTPSNHLSTSNNYSSSLKATSSGTPTLLVASTTSSLIATSSSMPTLLTTSSSMSTLLATNPSMPTLLATSSSSMPTLLASNSSTPTLLATNSGNTTLLATNSSIPALLATNSSAPTLIATSSVVANSCHNDPSPSGGRMQNQFLLLLPKPLNSSSTPFDQPKVSEDDSHYSIDLSKVPGKQREKLKEKIKEMLNAVTSKNLDPGKIIIAYDRT